MQLVYRLCAYDQLPQRSFNDDILGIIEMRIRHSKRFAGFVNKRRINGAERCRSDRRQFRSDLYKGKTNYLSNLLPGNFSFIQESSYMVLM